jgi:hypothetical protein
MNIEASYLSSAFSDESVGLSYVWRHRPYAYLYICVTFSLCTLLKATCTPRYIQYTNVLGQPRLSTAGNVLTYLPFVTAALIHLEGRSFDHRQV